MGTCGKAAGAVIVNTQLHLAPKVKKEWNHTSASPTRLERNCQNPVISEPENVILDIKTQ
jgi:hypothetical protein